MYAGITAVRILYCWMLKRINKADIVNSFDISQGSLDETLIHFVLICDLEYNVYINIILSSNL